MGLGTEEEHQPQQQEEEVFCSDGLPPIEVKPYVYGLGKKKGSEDDALLVEEQEGNSLFEDGVSPMAAFEVFQGKLMPSTSRSLYRKERVGSGPSREETPLEKLARLQNEVKELQADIAAVEANINPQAEDSETQTASASTDVAMLVQDLAAKLDAIDLSRKKPDSTPANLQTKLTQLVYDELAKMKEKEKGQIQEEKEGNAKQSSTDDTGSIIKYELYSKAGGAAKFENSSESFEARLLALEKALGSDISLEKISLSERLAAMERTVQSLDSTPTGKSNLSDVANRAKIIRADLEAAAKARSKLANVSGMSGMGGSSSAVDARQVSELYDQLLFVKEISAQLPMVVERCHDLAVVHTCAADSMSRLEAVENNTQRNETLLTGLESTLSKLEESAAENMMLMQQNVQQLEERLPPK